MISETHQFSCPICSAPSERRLSVSGYDYLLCSHCEHLYIDRKFDVEFGKVFYNSPSYKALEAKWPKAERLGLFANCISEAGRLLGRPPRRVLDYGAGTEDLEEKLRIFPTVEFYDPHFASEYETLPFAERYFDCVVLTEVLEHVFDPIKTLKTVSQFSNLCISTTLLNDYRFTLRYLIPEGGHVSIFSRESIRLAAKAANLTHSIEFWPLQNDYYYHLFQAKSEQTRDDDFK